MMEFGRKFLRENPGEEVLKGMPTWGSDRIVLGYPMGPYVIEGLDSALISFISSFFQETSSIENSDTVHAPAVVIEVRKAASEWFVTEFKEGMEDQHFDVVNLNANRSLVAGCGFFGEINRNGGMRGILWFPPQGNKVGFCRLVLMNFLRVVQAQRVLAAGGLAVHSSAVVYGGKAQLFLGMSGAGKSTLALLAIEAGLTTLSDDYNLVFPKGNGRGYLVQKVPYSGLYSDSEDNLEPVELQAIHLLTKGRENLRRRVSPEVAFRRVLQNAPVLNIDSVRFESVCDSIERLVREIPVYDLVFEKNEQFWKQFASF